MAVWPCYRLVTVEKSASLREMEDGTYSILDVLDANDTLDAWRDAEADANERAREAAK